MSPSSHLRLAELDAGSCCDGDCTCSLLATAVADPEAAAVVAALAALRAELGALVRGPMPDDVRTGILDAVAVLRSAEPAAGVGPPRRAARPSTDLPERRSDDDVGPAGTASATPRSGVSDGRAGVASACPGDRPVRAGRADAADSASAPPPRPGHAVVAHRPSGPVRLGGTTPGPCRVRRAGRPARRPRVAVAVAAAVLAVVGTILWSPVGAPPGVPGTIRTIGSSAGPVGPVGPLSDPVRQAACLAAVGVAPPPTPALAARRVQLGDTPGVLLVLPTGVLGRYRLLVVDPDCGPAGGHVLADRTLSR